MYVIVAYDVNEERVNKINKYLKRFLHWIQNSLFEGELTISQLEEIKEGIKEIIDEDIDSVRIYVLKNEKQIKQITIGVEKSETTMII